MNRFGGGLWLAVLALVVLVGAGVQAQDGLNLTHDLYVLSNDGLITRYGVGATGVSVVSDAADYALDFAVHPDNGLLAYRTADELVLRALSGAAEPHEQRRPLSEADAGPPIRGQGDSMAWSSDGSTLAYTTLTSARVLLPFSDTTQAQPVTLPSTTTLVSVLWSPLGGFLATEARNPDAESNFWWIYQRQNTAAGLNFVLVAALPSAVGVAWRDEYTLIFAPEAGGLQSLDLAQRGQASTLIPPDATYVWPHVLGDTSILMLERDATTPTQGRPRLLVGNSTQNAAINDTPIPLAGVRWSPDGGALMAFSGGTLALISPINGSGFTLPIPNAVAYGWGPLPLPTLREDSGERAAALYWRSAVTVGAAQVWRLATDSPQATPITAAPAPIDSYQISADGRQIAYASAGTLWLAAVPTGAVADVVPQAIEGWRVGGPYAFVSGAARTPEQLWFADAANGFSAWNGTVGEEVIPASPTGSPYQQLLANQSGQLAVLADGGALLLTPNGSQGLPSAERWLWLSDGRFAALRASGVTLSDATMTAVQPIEAAWGATLDIASTGDGLRVLLPTAQQRIGVLDVAADGALTPRLVLRFTAFGAPLTALVSPAGDWTTVPYYDGRLALYNLASGQGWLVASSEGADQVQWGNRAG